MAAFIAVVFTGAVFTGAAPTPAAEKWADPALPVTQGLEIWLDATRLPAAYEANGTSPPRAGGTVAAWYDASGHHRDATQDAPGRRPAFRTDLAKDYSSDGAAAVAFDGRDDGLLASVAGLDLHDFTVFVVAAPFSNGGTFRGFVSLNERRAAKRAYRRASISRSREPIRAAD
jgi:hypothetical protein